MKIFILRPSSFLPIMRGPLVFLAFGSICLGLTACASMMNEAQYPVTILSNPPPTTFIIKETNRMMISQRMTPNIITLPPSFGYFQPARVYHRLYLPRGCPEYSVVGEQQRLVFRRSRFLRNNYSCPIHRRFINRYHVAV